MEAGDTASPERARGNILAPRQLKAWSSNPGQAELLAHLRELESTLCFLNEQPQASDGDSLFLQQLRERLEQVKTWLETPHRRPSFRLEELPREILHEVHADMLLLIPTEMLASEALSVEELFRLNHPGAHRACGLAGPGRKVGPALPGGPPCHRSCQPIERADA